MSRYYLRKVTIEGFRGINNQGDPLVLDLDPDKVTSIFGRNGTGKSSTFESLAYAITGEIARLAGMQQRVENPSSYYLNKFHPGPATIGLVFEADDTGDQIIVTVTRDNSGQRTVTASGVSDAQAFLHEINCDTLLLDYNTFNEFVMSRPLERGRSFSKLLGLSKLSDLRGRLATVSDTRNLNSDSDLKLWQERLKLAQTAKAAAINIALQSLNKVVEHGLKPDEFSPERLEEICLSSLRGNPILGPLSENKRLIELDLITCRQRLEEAEGGQDRRELERLVAQKTTLDDTVLTPDVQSRVVVIRAEIARRNALVNASRGEGLKELYSAARNVLSGGWGPERCPLCEDRWDHPSGLSLPDYVQRELGAFAEILELESRLRDQWHALVRPMTSMNQLSALQALGIITGTPEILVRSVSITLPSEADVDALEQVAHTLEGQRIDALESLTTKIREVSARLPTSVVSSITALDGVEGILGALKDYQEALASERLATIEVAAIEAWRRFIKRIADEFADAESGLVRETTDLLEQDIREIYGSIMPGSDILPKLSREADTERLHLMLERFFGLTDVDAVPLLSESYRNALGLSVFLAASRRRSYGGKFLVLDDVTSSFDAGHQGFLVQAVYEHVARPQVPDGLQVIILSHDGLLEKLFDQAPNNGWSWNSIKLHGLPPAGLVTGTRSSGARVQAAITHRLANGDVDGALPLVRQYLEFRLMEIIREVGIRVPLDFSAREDGRMVGKMLEAIKHDIDIYTRLGNLVLPAGQSSQVTTTLLPSLIGNWVSHYETGSTVMFSPMVIQGVVATVDNLSIAFKYTCTCQNGRPRARFYRSLTQKQKGCGSQCT